MRIQAIVAFLVSLPGILTAQVERPRIFSAQRFMSLTAGVGNAMGWFGAQGERHSADKQLSMFIGLGYTSRLDRGDPTGPTFAAGVRSFTAGVKHRAFLEGGLSQVLVERGPLAGGSLRRLPIRLARRVHLHGFAGSRLRGGRPTEGRSVGRANWAWGRVYLAAHAYDARPSRSLDRASAWWRVRPNPLMQPTNAVRAGSCADGAPKLG